MTNGKRQGILKSLRRVEARIRAESEVKPTDVAAREDFDYHTKLLQKLKLKRLCLKSQLATELPMTIEGFLGENCEQVDQTERGMIQEIVHFLGCPNINLDRPFHPRISYDMAQDITEILHMNEGKYLRITIEAVEVGDRQKCASCENRFKCFTMDWKF